MFQTALAVASLVAAMVAPQADPATQAPKIPVSFHLKDLASQDPPKPAPANPEPAKPAQEQEQPAQPVLQPPVQPPQPPDQTLGKIKEYRGGIETVPYVRRLEDVRDLDTSAVDFEAPVIATVDGEPLTREQFQLWLAFTSGQQGIRSAQLQRLTEQAVKRITKDGGDATMCEVSDADVDAKLRAEEEQARAQGEQALVDYKKLVEETLGNERYRRLIKANLMSEKLLLPPIVKVEGKEPEGLPLEAADLLSDRTDLRDYLNNAYLTGTDFPAMFRTQFLLMLQEAQVNRADIKYAIETDLPKGVYMTINGEPVPTAEVLDFVPNSPDTHDLAFRLMLVYRAVDRELAKNNKALTPEEFSLMFEAHEAEYKNTLFPLPNLIRLRGFVSMPEYREYYRRRAAYQLMNADSVTEDMLMEHHKKFGKLFYENGKLTVDLLWNGLTEAEKDAGGDLNAAWRKALDNSQAALASVKSGSAIDSVRAELGNPYPLDPSGRLVAKTRNELRNFLAENEYTIFVNGYSLADDLFYNRVEGEVVGPMKVNRTLLPGMRSRMGYVSAQIVDFKKNSSLKDFVAQRQMVEQDFTDLNFTFWAHQCLKDSKIEFTQKRG